MLPRTNKDRIDYNRRVLAWLKSHAPAHAEELNAHGTARGWWDQVNYLRVTYKSVEQTARSIAANQL